MSSYFDQQDQELRAYFCKMPAPIECSTKCRQHLSPFESYFQSALVTTFTSSLIHFVLIPLLFFYNEKRVFTDHSMTEETTLNLLKEGIPWDDPFVSLLSLPSEYLCVRGERWLGPSYCF